MNFLMVAFLRMARPPKHKKANYSPSEQRAMCVDILQISTAMLRSGEVPECVGDAVVSAILRVARDSHGSVRKAAKAVGIPRTTYSYQLERGMQDLCHYLPMHGPLDDTLFPFIRIKWMNSDLGFLNECVQWMVDVVQPRAHAENTKLVAFQNYAEFAGNPTPEFVDALATTAGQLTDLAVFRGVVFCGPNHPNLMTLLNPAALSQGEDFKSSFIRFATDEATALGHAVQLFAATDLTSIPPLTLD